MQTSDITIIGAGVVGLATAYQLSRREPALNIVIIEKESEPASHQSGRNSGVLHSGIYYRPSSLKAELCRTGRQAMVEFCASEGIPYEVCGKVIVALDEGDLARLQALEERAKLNGVRATRITPAELHELEPYASGVAALHVPDTGVIDFRAVCRQFAMHVTKRSSPTSGRGTLMVSTRVYGTTVKNGSSIVHTSEGDVKTRTLVNCAGLQSDRVAHLFGQRPSVRIVPFKGEFYELLPQARSFVRNLIYPVPDPAFPFLGVHLTRMLSGTVECGPNAVLAMGREAYAPWHPSATDLVATFTAPGFWQLAGKHWRAALGEVQRSLSKYAFVKALQRLAPALRSEHLVPARAGIRAQALGADGKLVDDFVFEETDSVLSVCNAPSPAATASLAIGNVVADRVLRMTG